MAADAVNWPSDSTRSRVCSRRACRRSRRGRRCHLACSETAAPGRPRAGEGTTLMAEQPDSSRSLRDRRSVGSPRRPPARGFRLVQRPRYQPPPRTPPKARMTHCFAQAADGGTRPASPALASIRALWRLAVRRLPRRFSSTARRTSARPPAGGIRRAGHSKAPLWKAETALSRSGVGGHDDDRQARMAA